MKVQSTSTCLGVGNSGWGGGGRVGYDLPGAGTPLPNKQPWTRGDLLSLELTDRRRFLRLRPASPEQSATVNHANLNTSPGPEKTGAGMHSRGLPRLDLSSD